MFSLSFCNCSTGFMQIFRNGQDAETLSLFTPESLQQAEESGELDVDSNLLGLKPDPVLFVRFVKGLGRPDVSSELFVRLLEGYRELRSQKDIEPMKSVTQCLYQYACR